MIGCSGEVISVLEECNYQIFLYFPRLYSIKLRSLILGSISRIGNETNMFFPLLINYEMYLIGCRMVSNVRTNVGVGIDCLVDFKVQYPPLT